MMMQVYRQTCAHTQPRYKAQLSEKMYRTNLNRPLKYWPSSDNPIRDTQEHLLTCSKLKLEKQTLSTDLIKYDDIYGNVEEQKAVVTMVRELLEARNTLLNPNPTSGDDDWTQAPPGAVQDVCDNNCSVFIGNCPPLLSHVV